MTSMCRITSTGLFKESAKERKRSFPKPDEEAEDTRAFPSPE